MNMDSDNVQSDRQSVSLLGMVCFAVGGTLASGLFYLPGDFAAGGAYTLAVLLGWLICGVGILSMVGVYYTLGKMKPDLKSGLYAYAREGFGNYAGFNMAWGYWISALLAQVSFAIALFTGLGAFFPAFGQGSTFAAFIGQSLFLWLCLFLLSRGIKEAFGVNLLVVIAKIIPILALIVAILISRKFSMDVFWENITGKGSGLSVLEQVKSTMFMTVWIFIGFESAVVASGRSKDTGTAGKATLIAVLSLLAIYMMISLLSMGVMTQAELAALADPSMAGILEKVVGTGGAVFVAVAIVISVGGAMYSYTILCAECCYMPAQDGTFPRFLAKKNKRGVPVNAAVFTMLLVQLFLLAVTLNSSTYTIVSYLSTSMIILPYFCSVLYYLKLYIRNENGIRSDNYFFKKLFSGGTGVLAVAYGAWMIYASGLMYLLLTAFLYAPGIIFYYVSRKQNHKKLFDTIPEIIIFVIIVFAFLVAAVLIANGVLKPF